MFLMVKAIRGHFLAVLAGQPQQHPIRPSVGINKSGIPRLASFLSILLHGNVWDKRFLTTQLYLTRVLPGHQGPKFDTIENPFTGSISEGLLSEIVAVMEARNIKLPHSRWTKLHLTTKAGPMGPAMDQAMDELRLLPSWQVRDLLVLGGSQFAKYLREVQALVRLFPGPWAANSPKGSNLRKLSFVYDPEGKVRVIAILDYWSQTCLKPLHDNILSLQRWFKQDCTFNQARHLYTLRPNPFFYSYDLSAATDRFPITQQSFVIARQLGKEFANAWVRVLTKMPFATTGRKVFYNTGQPMGAYSSWPVFALCHHLVVLVAAMRANKGARYGNYMLLGDDIVIGDADVARNYTDIMGELGVPISFEKSLVSKDTIEFAKRLIHQGIDISPAPLRSWQEAKTTLSSLLSFQSQLEARWNTSTQVSRSAQRQLLLPLVPRKDLHLCVMRVRETWLMPSSQDTTEQRTEKIWLIYSELLRSYQGCSTSFATIRRSLCQMMARIRMSITQSTQMWNMQLMDEYFNKYAAHLLQHPLQEGVADELPVSRQIRLIPPLAVGDDQSLKGKDELERLFQFDVIGAYEEFFDEPPQIVFNPMVIVSGVRTRVTHPLTSQIPRDLKRIVSTSLGQRQRELVSKDT